MRRVPRTPAPPVNKADGTIPVTEFLLQAPFLLAVGFVAGALNALAGGGSFLTLPALILVGLPSVTANATGTLAQLPGYASSAFAAREDLCMPRGMSATTLVLISLAGSVAGAILLIMTPTAAFDAVVPWLLLASTAAFAFGPRLISTDDGGRRAPSPLVLLATLGVAAYGGYFNGGVGIVLLALFSLLGLPSINAANALKNLVSVLLALVSVVIYVWGGVIAWPQALLMMVATTSGGFISARVIRRFQGTHVRHAVIAIGCIMTVIFFFY